MQFKQDITERIEMDFPNTKDQVLKIINDGISKADYLNKDRILRCIIFLANGDIQNLHHYIEVATLDPRDVMFGAEYIGGFNDAKRIRDFNKTFDECENDVKE